MRKIGLPPTPYLGAFPKTYLRDRKNRLSFATNSTARYRGQQREIVMEVFPEYAAVRLLVRTCTRYEVSWQYLSWLRRFAREENVSAKARKAEKTMHLLVACMNSGKASSRSLPHRVGFGISMISLNGNTEFGFHVFKRRTPGKQEDRYTIGVWKGDVLLAICHDACLECALAALRREMERDRGELVALSPNTREASRD